MRALNDSLSSAADLAACRTLLRSGSRTFFAASLLLPPGIRAPATALYAFCRVADDEIDQGDGEAALPRLRERLRQAYGGRPSDSPVDRALADMLERFAIPSVLPEALLDGFAWDAEGRTYEDLPALRAYAMRVAGTVGAMMALLMRARSPEALARACDLGVAMQLSNIARDVGEDARNGRIYLPLCWLREAGIDPAAWLAAPSFNPALGSVVERLLAEAERLYRRSVAGINALPLSCRPGISAARHLYAAIGHEVAFGGLDSVSRRAVVPPLRKLSLLSLAFAAVLVPARTASAPALDEAAFLLDAVAAMPASRSMPRERGIDRQVAWLVDLFTRLEQRDQMGAERA